MQSENTPLTGVVRTMGTPPSLSVNDLAARVADLNITLKGGKAGSPVSATITVVLNTTVAITETAEMIDEGLASRVASATRKTKGYVFRNVKLTEPGGAAARVFRITNVRAKVSGLGSGGNNSLHFTVC
jgi:hypothetical protein